MNIKTWLNDLQSIQPIVNQLENIKLHDWDVWGNGDLKTDKLTQYTNQIKGLNAEQAKLALSTTSLTNAQRNQVLVEAGLIASSDKISAGLIKEALANTNLSKKQQKLILEKLELWNSKKKEIIASKSVTKADLEETLSKKNVSKENQRVIMTSIGLENQSKKEVVSHKLVSQSLKERIAEQWQLMKSNPLTWIMAITAAITVAKKVYDAATTSVAEHQEKIDELNSSLSTLKSEYDELNSKDKDSLSDSEKERLEYLKDRIDLEQKLLDIEEKKQATQKYSKDIFDKDTYAHKTYFDSDDSLYNETERKTDRTKYTVNEYKKAVENGDEEKQLEYTVKLEQKRLEYEEAYLKNQQAISDIQEDINNGLITKEQGNKWIAKYQDSIDFAKEQMDVIDSVIPHVEDASEKLADNLKGVTETELKDAFDSDELEKLASLEFGVDYDENTTIEEFESLLDKIQVDADGNPVTIKSEFDSTSFLESISDIQSGYDTLLSAQEEFNEYGAITASTLKTLMENDLLQYLQFTADGLSINTQELENNEQALKNQATAELYSAMCNDIQNLSLNDTTQLSSIAQSAIANLDSAATTAGKNASVAAQGWWEYGASIQSIPGVSDLTGDSYNKAQAIVKQYQNIARSINSISIGKTNSSKKSSKSSNSGSSSAKKTMEDIQKEWKEYLDKYLAMYKAELDAGLIDFNTFLNKSRSLLDEFYRDGKISAKDYWDSIKELNESQLSIYDKVLSAVTRRIEKEVDGIQDIIDGLEKQNDVLQKQLDKYDSILAAVEEVYDNRIDVLNKQKEAIQDNIDKLQDENDEHNRALELEKAKWNLYKAMNNRTKRVFNGTEFIYKTDRNEVREAQKNLQDLTLEQTISAMEKEIGLLEDQIEVLEEFKSKWSDISDAYEKEVNRQNAILLWGREYEKMILSNRLSDIDSFKNGYISIQDQINDNQSTIDSLEEKKEIYEALKEQWSDISKAYEQSQEDQYASMVLGAQWESDVLSGRINVLNNFKNQYIAIQQAITNAALEAARAQANAQSIQASSASSGGGGSSYSGGSSNSGNEKVLQLQHFMNQVFGSNLTEDGIMGSKTKEAIKRMQLLIGAQQTGRYDKATYDKLRYYVGKTLRKENKTLYDIAKRLGYPAYAKGTTNAKKGVALVSEKEHGDEIIIDNNDNAYVAEGEQLHYFEGGETVIKASESEKILTNMENLTPLQDYVSPFSGVNFQPIDYSSMVMSSLNLPDFSKLATVNMDNSTSVSIGEIHLHEVNNVDSFANAIIRELPSKISQKLG